MARRFSVAHLNVVRFSKRNISTHVDRSLQWSSAELPITEASTPPTSWYTDGTEFDNLLS